MVSAHHDHQYARHGMDLGTHMLFYEDAIVIRTFFGYRICESHHHHHIIQSSLYIRKSEFWFDAEELYSMQRNLI